MRRPRLLVDSAVGSHFRRGGERGTGAASGSLASGGATSRPAIPAAERDNQGVVPAVHAGPLLLEAVEVARLLCIGRTKVYELIARRSIPTVRVGRCVRVPASGLARWIDANTSPSLDE